MTHAGEIIGQSVLEETSAALAVDRVRPTGLRHYVIRDAHGNHVGSVFGESIEAAHAGGTAILAGGRIVAVVRHGVGDITRYTDRRRGREGQ